MSVVVGSIRLKYGLNTSKPQLEKFLKMYFSFLENVLFVFPIIVVSLFLFYS